jgi:hypothetical protein
MMRASPFNQRLEQTGRAHNRLVTNGRLWAPTLNRRSLNGATPTTMSWPEIIEDYRAWTPPLDVKKIVARLLKPLPERYVGGLGAIVLRNASGFARDRRRKKTRSRGRAVPIANTLGLYHQAVRDRGMSQRLLKL